MMKGVGPRQLVCILWIGLFSGFESGLMSDLGCLISSIKENGTLRPVSLAQTRGHENPF
jgi:hypothetical protein